MKSRASRTMCQIGEERQRRQPGGFKSDTITENCGSGHKGMTAYLVRFEQGGDFLVAPRTFGFGIGTPPGQNPVRISVSVLEGQPGESASFNLSNKAKEIIWAIGRTGTKHISEPRSENTLKLINRVLEIRSSHVGWRGRRGTYGTY